MKFTKKRLAIFVGVGMTIVTLVIAALAVFLSFSFGVAVGEKRLSEFAEKSTGNILNKRSVVLDQTEADFESFWKAWALLEDKFVGFPSSSTSSDSTTPKDQQKVWGAISGLASSYKDPYTVFFPPVENELFEADIKGEFSGVGMEIGVRDGALTVVSPLPGTPAEKSGVLAKDTIIKIDGVDSISMPTAKAVQLIRGEKGSVVELTILREGQSGALVIPVTRDVIQIPTIETEIIDETFIIKLYSFSQKSPELFRDALKEFSEAGNDKLIIDLRGNPGGYLQAAVSISSWFLPSDKLVVREDKGSEAGREYYSLGYNIFSDDLRLVILTDGGSASASEIVAAALADNKKALLVGQDTFGKGSVQELVEITPETSLKVTIARWLTPSGNHISNEGIAPDIFVNRDLENLDNDAIQIKAIEILKRSDFFELFNEVPADLQELTDETQ